MQSVLFFLLLALSSVTSIAPVTFDTFDTDHDNKIDREEYKKIDEMYVIRGSWNESEERKREAKATIIVAPRRCAPCRSISAGRLLQRLVAPLPVVRSSSFTPLLNVHSSLFTPLLVVHSATRRSLRSSSFAQRTVITPFYN